MAFLLEIEPAHKKALFEAFEKAGIKVPHRVAIDKALDSIKNHAVFVEDAVAEKTLLDDVDATWKDQFTLAYVTFATRSSIALREAGRHTT